MNTLNMNATTTTTATPSVFSRLKAKAITLHQKHRAWNEARSTWTVPNVIYQACLGIVNSLLFLFVIGLPTYCNTPSMEPTFQHGNFYLANSLEAVFKKDKGVDYNDIVVFKCVDQMNDIQGKRVIGMGGDTIEIKAGVVYRNGVALDEPYEGKPFEYKDPVVVPEGELYLLGDNRTKSIDSRYWTDPTLSLDNVVAKFYFVDQSNALYNAITGLFH